MTTIKRSDINACYIYYKKVAVDPEELNDLEESTATAIEWLETLIEYNCNGCEPRLCENCTTESAYEAVKRIKGINK